MSICVHCHKEIGPSAGRSLFDEERIFEKGPKVHAKSCYPMAQTALHLTYLKLFNNSAERSGPTSFSAS